MQHLRQARWVLYFSHTVSGYKVTQRLGSYHGASRSCSIPWYFQTAGDQAKLVSARLSSSVFGCQHPAALMCTVVKTSLTITL
jgi:hypothetical protein